MVSPAPSQWQQFAELEESRAPSQPHRSQNHRGWKPLQPSKHGARAGSISDLCGCYLLKGRVRWVTGLR